MSKKINFYTISFEDFNGKVIRESIADFMYNITSLMDNNIEDIKKEISNRKIRCFSIVDDYKSLDQFVLPFGKLKNNNSYKEDDTAKKLSIVDYDIYDVNLLYYDQQQNIMFLTQDKNGPSYKQIEMYLNQFVDKSDRKRISINPVYKNDDIEKLKNAKRISKMILKFDFSRSTSELINRRMNAMDTGNSLTRSLKDTIFGVRDANTQNLTMEMSAGKHKLDKDTLIEFIEAMELNDDYIKEIEVHYAYGEKETTTPARLKRNNLILSHNINIKEAITPEILTEKIKDGTDSRAQSIIKQYINDFYPTVRKYFSV